MAGADNSEAVAEQPPGSSRGAWKRVAGHAAQQRGYVDRDQLREAGLTRAAIRWAVREGRLFRRRGGLFLVGHTYKAPDAEWCAALFIGGDGAVAAFRLAGLIWGLLKAPQPLEVIAPKRWHTKAPVTIHQGQLDLRREVTHRHGFPVTTLLRTIVDLAAVLSEAELAVAVNEAAIKGWMHRRNVAKLLALSDGRRGARNLRRVLAARDRSYGYTRSSLEDAFAKLAREAGLPTYERGVLVDIGDGDLRECDVLFREQRVMVELDYLPIHENGYVPYRDRRRDRRFTAQGWIVIRITPEDLELHRDEVIADLLRALARTQGRS